MAQSDKRVRIFLYPGTMVTACEPAHISTVLGSCVATCLWDPVRRVGGMNHFLFPAWSGEGVPTPRYGDVAVPLLVEELRRLGCRLPDIRAKLFGGAHLAVAAGDLFELGASNLAKARWELERHGIPVIASRVGGACGRKVIFDTADGSVYVSRTP